MSQHAPHPPFKISRRLAIYCLFRGQEAADAGQPFEVCPYIDLADDFTSFYARHWWLRGWAQRQPGGCRASEHEPLIW